MRKKKIMININMNKKDNNKINIIQKISGSSEPQNNSENNDSLERDQNDDKDLK